MVIAVMLVFKLFYAILKHMNGIESFFWYDLETFGLNPCYDRIAQFAGQRTDLNLNPIGDPVVLYCRLSADYLPDPGACLVTGITPQEVKRKGLPESEFIQTINRLFSQAGTCVVGFNSIHFDDEFIRNALYRNFLDPYEREWKNGCSRWDILDLVRACHDFRPQGINWPPAKENGNPVFKLTELTAANRIDQTGAHDAMVDVNATIAVAKLIKEKQPRLFEHYLKLRQKTEVKNCLRLQDSPHPLLHTCASFTNPHGCTSMICAISPKVDQDNSIWCFDLAKDPSVLISASPESVYKTPGLFKLAINKSPFLAETNTLKAEDYERLGIDYKLCMEHMKTLVSSYSSIVKALMETPAPEYRTVDDPDYQIYSKFFSDHDKDLFRVIRNTPAEQRLSLNLNFSDSRCKSMLWRHVCRNYPEVLTDREMAEFKSFASSRLLCPPDDSINDFFFVGRKIDEKLEDNSLSVREKATLACLKEYFNSLKQFLGL